jgi:hypothetical protein
VCAGSTLLLAEDESTSIVKRRPCWSVIKPVRITFSRIVCSFPERLNLGFLLREKTCCCAHHTFRLEFPNCLAIIIINYMPDIKPFSGTVAGEEVEDLCKGIFSNTHPLLCYLFCFTLFILLASFYIKNPKNLESLVVVISLP